jgi:hypothetical protein
MESSKEKCQKKEIQKSKNQSSSRKTYKGEPPLQAAIKCPRVAFFEGLERKNRVAAELSCALSI